MAAPDLPALAASLRDALEAAGETLVLAESCTGGLAAATLVGVPGASRVFAGSLVAYQEVSKTAWLGVSPDVLARDTAVSRPVAGAMAAGALDRTPHATVAGAITGHLDPHADGDRGGLLFVAVARRGGSTAVREVRLRDEPADRVRRQTVAAWHLLEAVHALTTPAPSA